jgi:hypothetical protein
MSNDQRAIVAPTARLITVAAAAVLAVVGVSHGGALSSAARMTDTRSTTPATVASGSIALSLTNGASAGTWLGAVTLAPGASSYAGLTITNTGTVPLRYAATATSTSALSAALKINVVALPTGTTTCSAATYLTGTLASAADTAFGATPEVALIGSTAAGAQAGDRTLAASGAERLCLKVTFPAGRGLGAGARGTVAATTFSFIAESS